jgi:hypothetical protein
VRLAARVGTLGAAALTVFAAVTSGGSAVAAPLVPTGSQGFNLTSSSSGLVLDLFGTELTGAQTSASVSYVAPTGGAVSETSNASGQGVFLTQGSPQTVALDTAKGDNGAKGSTNDFTCFQGGGTPAGTPISINLGIGCALAYGSVDNTGVNGPQAQAESKVVDLSVDLSSILHQLASGGATQLCSALSQIPTLGSQILGPACSDVLSSVSPTVDVTIGSALSKITTDANTLLATSSSSSIDVKLFPVLGQPLLEVTIPSAVANTSYTNGQWSNTYDATLIKISGRLVDDINAASGGAFPDPLEIPPNNSGTSQLQALNSSPLGALISIDLASGSTSGNSVSADGLKVTLLGGSTSGLPVPGLPSAPGGGIVIDTAGVSTSSTPTAGAGGTTPASAPAGSTPQTPGPVATAAASSPTSVHTGEWWAGSLPFLALLAGTGGMLIGWPRLRKLHFVSRLVSRGSR